MSSFELKENISTLIIWLWKSHKYTWVHLSLNTADDYYIYLATFTNFFDHHCFLPGKSSTVNFLLIKYILREFLKKYMLSNI